MTQGRKVKDLTDLVFSKLTVIEQDGWYYNPSGYRNAKWLCLCECGNRVSVSSPDLIRGHTKSCGCLFKFAKGRAAFNSILIGYKSNAKRRGREFSLTDEEFESLTKGCCYYCGIPPSTKLTHKSYNGAYTYNGVDRINNTKGYTKENSVSCCSICNRAKSTMSQESFLQWIQRLINYRGK